MLEGELPVDSLRASQVGHEDQGTSFRKYLLEGWEGGAYAGIVSDVEFLVKRDVEVNPDNGLLSFEIVSVDVLLHNFLSLLL